MIFGAVADALPTRQQRKKAMERMRYWCTVFLRERKEEECSGRRRSAQAFESKKDSSGTFIRLKTFNEYRSKLEDINSFLIIRSEEVTSSFENKPYKIGTSTDILLMNFDNGFKLLISIFYWVILLLS